MTTVVPVSPRPRIIEPDAIEPGFRQQRVAVVLVVVLLCIRHEETPT
ncbi:hypothetical protein [Kaistia adipata]|nr:hypothetical protein [Kaistia adipata]